MVAPKFALASPIGQTSIRAVFDRPMRDLGPESLVDPVNPDLWTSGGGLPDVISAIRHSLVEFELVLAEPAPLGSAYTLTVAETVESTKGEVINPAFVTQTFDVVIPDLIVEAINWTAPNSFDLVFSAPIQELVYDKYSDILIVQPTNGGRQVTVTGLQQSGSLLRVTLSAAGTAGATYSVTLERDLFIAQGSNVVLRTGDENQEIWGQGNFGSIASASATQNTLQATFTEPLNFGHIDPKPGLPLFPGAYAVSSGSLGSVAQLGTTPATVTFPSAQFTAGDSVQWSLARTTRTVASGQSFLDVASSTVGSGSETVVPGVSTALNKAAGIPYEVVFSGGMDSLTRTGRRFSTTLRFDFTPSATSYPLLALTFLNTQLSLVFSKTENNQATLRLYRGANPLGVESVPFNPTIPFALAVVDASSDVDGFVSVLLDGVVVAGASADEVLDPLLIDINGGVTAFAFTLGSPDSAAETFSAVFTAPISFSAFLTTGLRGQNSRDLVSFSGSQTTVVAAVTPTPSGSPGFQNTGKAAFGVYAEYMNEVDAIQVVVGLNQNASIPEFTGSVSLLTGQKDVIDQQQIDQSTVLVGEGEVIVVFLHPKLWSGVQVGVALDIAGATYSVIVPVASGGQPVITGQLTQQPANWYHQRLPQLPAAVSAYGPAVVIG
jgi:hypothetical protein